MAHSIKYICCCNTGRVRKINQDNFWVNRQYMYSENFGLETPLKGTQLIAERPTYAVFDGMGGEKCGEVASFISAHNFSKCMKKVFSDPVSFLNETCYKMNDEVCNFMLKYSIKSMGSTAAIIMFDRNCAIVCNLGDSGVFRVCGNELLKLSTDHVDSGSAFSSKPMLTQFVGIPKEEYLIEPSIKTLPYAEGDRFLLCSDGLTDMVSEAEIAAIISANSLENAANLLLEKALANGGVDNTTIILCEVQ